MSSSFLHVNKSHKDKYRQACTYRHTFAENHWVSPFPASWLASMCYCPALKHDPVPCCWLLLFSHVAEDKAMFPILFFFFCPPCQEGEGLKIKTEHLFFQCWTVSCDWGRAECAEWERGGPVKDSSHKGHVGQSYSFYG